MNGGCLPRRLSTARLETWSAVRASARGLLFLYLGSNDAHEKNNISLINIPSCDLSFHLKTRWRHSLHKVLQCQSYDFCCFPSCESVGNLCLETHWNGKQASNSLSECCSLFQDHMSSTDTGSKFNTNNRDVSVISGDSRAHSG